MQIVQNMTTKQYAEYYRKITGLYISPSSVGHLCRKGELDAFKEPEGKQWIIKVKNPAVYPEDYEALNNKCISLQTTIMNINKLLGGAV